MSAYVCARPHHALRWAGDARRPRGTEATLAPVFGALTADAEVDLSRLRVVADWVQYRSRIWAFNALYWGHLRDWEEVTGRGYESALPGGQSDAPWPTPTGRCGSRSPARSPCPGGCDAYADRADLVRALARVLNAEARSLADAGAGLPQVDEPFLAGHPEQVGLAIEALNIVVAGVPVTWALHVCSGNRYARPLWEGHYDRALRLGRADRLIVTPDCGLRHLPAPTARAKLRTMTAAAAAVRRRLTDERS